MYLHMFVEMKPPILTYAFVADLYYILFIIDNSRFIALHTHIELALSLYISETLKVKMGFFAYEGLCSFCHIMCKISILMISCINRHWKSRYTVLPWISNNVAMHIQMLVYVRICKLLVANVSCIKWYNGARYKLFVIVKYKLARHLWWWYEWTFVYKYCITCRFTCWFRTQKYHNTYFRNSLDTFN